MQPQPFQNPHSRWLAVTHRTPSSHSSFLYGVKSTKIYCRPTCAARLARRANIVFYDSADQARRDGFRPCKRCKPDNPAFVGEGEQLVARVLALLRVEQRGGGAATMKRSLKQIAAEVGVSPSYLCRVFKKVMGVTVGDYMVEFERESPGNNNIDAVESQADTEMDDFDLDEWFFTDEFLHDSTTITLSNSLL